MKKEKKRKIRISVERKQLKLLAERIICFHKGKFSKREFNASAISCRNIDNSQVTFKNRN